MLAQIVTSARNVLLQKIRKISKNSPGEINWKLLQDIKILGTST